MAVTGAAAPYCSSYSGPGMGTGRGESVKAVGAAAVAVVSIGFIASGAELVGLSSLVGLDSPSLSLPGNPAGIGGPQQRRCSSARAQPSGA